MPLLFIATLLISVQDRQEHGQDVYTAECKHFPWPSLNKKSSKSPVRSANTQSDASVRSVLSGRWILFLHMNIVCIMKS